MEQIPLGNFNFGVDDVVKGASEIKKAIDQIKKDQASLKKSGKTSSTTFVEMDAALKVLNKEYNSHIKALAESSKAAQTAEIRESKLELVLGQEVKTIKEAREQNKLLNQLRNDANLTTAEGQQEVLLLNEALDRNNELIKENADQYLQQKINIGNYSESIKEAFDELNVLDGGITNITQNFFNMATSSKEAGGGQAFLTNTLKGTGKAIIGVTKSALAFIATPVGLVVAAIAVVFLLVKNAMNRSEEATNKLTRAFAPLSGILDGVLSLLEPLGEFLIDGIVFGMELATEAIFKIQEAFASLLRLIGADKFADNVTDFNNAMKESAANAVELADAEAKLEKAQRRARLTQLQYMKEAETFRQIRDDESLSISERIKANQKLGAILSEQLAAELEIAQQALIVANLRIQAEGQTSESLDRQAAALENIADIEERINGQRSEQLVNENSLRREAADKASEAADRRIAKMNEELDLFIANQGVRARTLQEDLELERQISAQRLDILKEELRSKKITQDQFDTEVRNSKNEESLRLAEISSNNALREIEIIRDLHQQRMAEESFLTEGIAENKKQANDLLLEQEAQYKALQLDQGLIDQDTFDQAIRELTETNRVNNKAIDDERIAAEKEEAIELRALEFEEELARLLEEGAAKDEILKEQQAEQRAVAQAALDAEKEKGLISEELYLARLADMDRQAGAADLERTKLLREQKLGLTQTLLSGIGALVDKNSAAGKAIAIAQAGINTFQGITEGLKAPFPLNIAMPILAGVTGLAAVKKIASTKVPSARGGGSVGGGGGGASLSLGSSALSGQGTNLSSISASNNSGVQNQVAQNSALTNLDGNVGKAVEEGAKKGTMAGAEEGIVGAADNRTTKQETEF